MEIPFLCFNDNLAFEIFKFIKQKHLNNNKDRREVNEMLRSAVDVSLEGWTIVESTHICVRKCESRWGNNIDLALRNCSFEAMRRFQFWNACASMLSRSESWKINLVIFFFFFFLHSKLNRWCNFVVFSWL